MYSMRDRVALLPGEVSNFVKQPIAARLTGRAFQKGFSPLRLLRNSLNFL
jgi:hypothetical protein